MDLKLGLHFRGWRRITSTNRSDILRRRLVPLFRLRHVRLLRAIYSFVLDLPAGADGNFCGVLVFCTAEFFVSLVGDDLVRAGWRRNVSGVIDTRMIYRDQ